MEKVFRFNTFDNVFLKHSLQNAFSFCASRCIASLLILISSKSGFAQGSTAHQSLYWLRYYNQTQLSSSYILHIEVDERRFFNPDLQSQFFAHVHLHKKFSKTWDVGIGVTHARTNSNKNNDLVIPEWRPFQEVTFTKPLFSKLQTQFRYRLDERFVHNNNRTELTDGYNFILRHRFRVQVALSLKKSESGKSVTLKLSEELMLNSTANANTFDQNRIYAGIEWPLSKKWSAELGYLNQYQSAPANEYFDRDILRFTLYHRLSLAKSN